MRTAATQTTADAQQTIVIEGSTKESVTLQLSDFHFAESEGNYVSVHYMQDGELRRTLLRTSMKSVIAQLCSISKEVMQCHRAYVVNLHKVESVEGRSSGIGLKLYHCDTIIPVSKGYVNEVKERIKNP